MHQPTTKSAVLPQRARWLLRGLATALMAAALALIGQPAPTPVNAAFPGANGKVVFQSIRGGAANTDVYVMNNDGSGQVRLTTSEASDSNPRWSPDGTKIAFSSNRDVNFEIYVMNSDGSAQTNLTNNVGQDFTPNWSWDGSKIVFASIRDGASTTDVYVMNSDGSGLARLTDHPGSDGSPHWSPDGAKILFVSSRDGNNEIYIMNSDGTVQTNLTNSPASDLFPNWSPDGAKIAFASNREFCAPPCDPRGDFEIHVMNRDGTGVTRVTNVPGADVEPAWSPDGAKIMFASSRNGDYEIYVMNADGSGQTNLSNNSPANDQNPDWQPIANSPPTANAGSHQTVECTSHAGALVTLNGAASDPDGDVLSFVWKEGSTVLGSGAVLTVTLPRGSHTVTLTVDDGKGGTASDDVLITVADTTPPSLNVSLSPNVLWPPEHQLVEINASIAVSDTCDPSPSIVLLSVVSNEADNGVADGNTDNDVQGVTAGTDDRSFQVRAERSAVGSGRVYTATYRATDASGNSAEVSATVVVPLNQSGP